MAVSCRARCWPDHWEKFGVQCLAQRRFNKWTGGAGDRTAGSVISGQPAHPWASAASYNVVMHICSWNCSFNRKVTEYIYSSAVPLRYLYFTWVFPSYITLYSTTLQREILLGLWYLLEKRSVWLWLLVMFQMSCQQFHQRDISSEHSSQGFI